MTLSLQREELAQQAQELEISAETMRAKNSAKIEERKARLKGQIDAKRKAKRADYRADGTESDALDAVDSAAFVLQEAELAVLNAMDERSTAYEKETVSVIAGNEPK